MRHKQYHEALDIVRDAQILAAMLEVVVMREIVNR